LLFGHIAKSADILVLCGDLTDRGTPDEARSLAKDLNAHVKIPCVGVLGNHDYESGKHEEVKGILKEAGINILDGDAIGRNKGVRRGFRTGRPSTLGRGGNQALRT
jgi:predicted MPP superfamily phosphohydrolase